MEPRQLNSLRKKVAPRWLTVEETAEALGVTTNWVRLELGRGNIHGVKMGRRWQFPPEEITEYRTNRAQEFKCYLAVR
jgi:excisionase family DNA binding protein